MVKRRTRGIIGALGLVATLSVLQAQESEPPRTDVEKPAPEPPSPTSIPPAADREGAEKAEFFRRRLDGHRIQTVGKAARPFEMIAEPLIRFDNPVSRIDDGHVFLWTDRGRPAAIAKSYYHTPYRRWGRTFVSLAPDRIEMRIDGDRAWTPTKRGLTFAALDGAAPAEDPRRRLIQMREIAKGFEVIDNWGLTDPTDWQLRLLSTPLHRYAVPEEKVIDGALFGYVLTTSPEALLLLEARETGRGREWHYALARFTRFEVTVAREGHTLATFPRLEGWPPSGTYFHMSGPISGYPFHREE